MNLFQQSMIRVGALFSYCGGPLIVCDMLKPRLGTFLAFDYSARQWLNGVGDPLDPFSQRER
jgi:hypothetical protein